MTVARPTGLTVGTRVLPLPVYFPSISSVKTALRPQEYLQLLSSLGRLKGQFLVSAFDLAGTGRADPASFAHAVAMARQMVRGRLAAG